MMAFTNMSRRLGWALALAAVACGEAPTGSGEAGDVWLDEADVEQTRADVDVATVSPAYEAPEPGVYRDPDTGITYNTNPGWRVLAQMPVPTGNLENGSSELGTLRSALSLTDTDDSGFADIIIVECLEGPAPGVINSSCDVPPNYVLIGGGAEDRWVGWPNGAGALLTESRPSDINNGGDGVRWIASSKDHNIANNHSLSTYAVGLSFQGLTRAQLKARIDYRMNTGVSANHAISSCTSPAGMRLIGGGARANSPQQLLVHSFPNANRWNAKSKDHNRASPGTITAFCISTDIPLIIQHRSRSASTSSGLLQARGTVSQSLVPSCFGARSTFSGAGRLLWSMRPLQTQAGLPFRDFFAGSKDHQIADSGTLEAWVTEIGF